MSFTVAWGQIIVELIFSELSDQFEFWKQNLLKNIYSILINMLVPIVDGIKQKCTIKD